MFVASWLTLINRSYTTLLLGTVTAAFKNTTHKEIRKWMENCLKYAPDRPGGGGRGAAAGKEPSDAANIANSSAIVWQNQDG